MTQAELESVLKAITTLASVRLAGGAAYPESKRVLDAFRSPGVAEAAMLAVELSLAVAASGDPTELHVSLTSFVGQCANILTHMHKDARVRKVSRGEVLRQLAGIFDKLEAEDAAAALVVNAPAPEGKQ